MQIKPYFMKNKEWYRYDAKENKYVLTEKAPPKAQEYGTHQRLVLLGECISVLMGKRYTTFLRIIRTI